MRRGFIGLTLAVLGLAWLSAQGPYLSASRPVGAQNAGEVGMDAAKLNEAVAFMKAHETTSPTRDFSDQEIVNGKLLGVDSHERAGTNALIIRHGYIVAEFGDTMRPDPTYSVAKSMLSTVAGIALDRGLIPNLDDPVGKSIKDGGYDSPHNQADHLAESSAAGIGVGRRDVGQERQLHRHRSVRPRRDEAARRSRRPAPSTNTTTCASTASALSLLRLFKKPMPDVFRDEVMNPIGASTTWKWVPYTNAYVNIDGKRMASVSGGTRWGGGMWISSVRHGALRPALAARRQVGRQADRLAGVREDGDDGERARSGLRLPVVAEHDRQMAGLADGRVRSAGPGRQRHPHRSGARPRRRVALERAVGGGIQENRRRYY